MRALLIFLALVTVPTSWATEIDSYHGRSPFLSDITPLVNTYVNTRLRRALTNVDTCDSAALDSAVYSQLGQFLIGGFERYLLLHPQIAQSRTPLEQSIYRDFPLEDAWVLYTFNLAMGPLINVAHQFIGADKFGHFFAEGHTYYRKGYLEGKGIKEALIYGKDLETGFYGASNTGINSHGDLAANFSGMRFWRALAHTDDFTGQLPHFTCNQGRYILTRPFDAADYVNVAWDEAYNCNEYATPTLAAMASARISAYSGADGMPYACPIDINACANMRIIYGDWSLYVLTPACL